MIVLYIIYAGKEKIGYQIFNKIKSNNVVSIKPNLLNSIPNPEKFSETNLGTTGMYLRKQYRKTYTMKNGSNSPTKIGVVYIFERL